MATNRSILPERGPQVAVAGHFGPLEVVEVDTKKWEAGFQCSGAGAPFGPTETAPLSAIDPLSEEDSEKFWKMLVSDLMAKLQEEHALPAFVKDWDVTTGIDSTGEPAVYVKILVAPRSDYSPAMVAQWQEFSTLLQQRLTPLRFMKRYLYIQFGEKRRGR